MYQKCNDESVDIIKDITKLSNINVEGIFTHFATSDMKNKEYVYKQFIEKLGKKGVMIPIKHISNTGIILDSPELHQDMVRFGSMVYGTYSSYDIKTERVRLKDALSIRACAESTRPLRFSMYSFFDSAIKSILSTLISLLFKYFAI